MAPLSRRAFLAVATWFAALLRLGADAQASQPAAVTLDQFVELSARLVERSKLDPEIAQIYLNALLADPDGAVHLANLVQSHGNPTPEQAVLSRTIIEWWYTGVYRIDGQPRVATHLGALMWSALGISAPGTCAGPFGAWSRAPQDIA